MIINAALKIATKAHKGQYRKGSGRLPYIIHPLEVASFITRELPTETAYATAVLHDVIEDCGFTENSLVKLLISKGVAKPIAEEIGLNVAYLSNNVDSKLIDAPYLAQMVKLADIRSNTTDKYWNYRSDKFERYKKKKQKDYCQLTKVEDNNPLKQIVREIIFS